MAEATTKSSTKVEFGDFQTPERLARDVCSLLSANAIQPASVLEPTCGVGNFIIAAAETFSAARVIGVEVQDKYVKQTANRISERFTDRVTVEQGNFFQISWDAVLRQLPDPALILGNPPWVTNSGMQVAGGGNLPAKSNFRGMTGIDAITGKSNFDVSEWMMVQLVEASDGRQLTVAMVLKTAVARKTLQHIWADGLQVCHAEMRIIDAKRYFNASVPACVLILCFSPGAALGCCDVYTSLLEASPTRRIGWSDCGLIADIDAFHATKHLIGDGEKWRSGIKHDCSKVMELKRHESDWVNGLGEKVDIEDEHLFPMYKSSQVAAGARWTDRYMIVPQRSVGEATEHMRFDAPQTWQYLSRHAALFEMRRSSIYRGRPKFAIFGVGKYSFAPWKVAISGFYSNFAFHVFGPQHGRPPVFDDTVYFLECQEQAEGKLLAHMLNSDLAQRFFHAFTFLDAKRPVTTALLRRLDIGRLARELGMELAYRQSRAARRVEPQHRLFDVD